MLRRVAGDVLVHQSEFCQSNAIVVPGRAGSLLVDPGIYESEMACLADDLSAAGLTVAAGFSTHDHWDHVLWHSGFGSAPRYGTARCAATVRAEMAGPQWQDRIAEWIPPDIVEQMSWELYGLVNALPADSGRIAWDGPQALVLEHQGHAAGHAALLIADGGVLVAGDMLSDKLIPMLDFDAADPIGDYLAGLLLIEGVAGDVDVLIPGHGSVAGADEMRARIELDRAYVEALHDGAADDPRVGPDAPFDWMAGVHERQLRQLGRRRLGCAMRPTGKSR